MHSACAFSAARQALGRDCVLLVGSFISARPRAAKPFVPGVVEARHAVMRSIADQLERNATGNQYLNQITAAYVRALLNPGSHYQRILEGLKFEEFVWRIQRAVSPSNLSGLMRALFDCGPGQWDHNHGAIAKLMMSGQAPLVLTTNFDNAIERAAQALANGQDGITCEVMPSPDAMTQERSATQRTLIKLHGDTGADIYVTTSPDLYDRSTAARASKLKTLLRGKTVIVLGYGGRGDIDIYPELLACHDTKFIWLVYKNDKSDAPLKVDGHPYTEAIRGDLTELGSGNPLMHLTDRTGSSPCGDPPDWQDRLTAWAARLELHELHDIVRLILANGGGTPDLHLRYLGSTAGTDDPARFNRERISLLFMAYINIADYRSARAVLASTPGADTDQLALWQGFILWRTGQRMKALNVLQYFPNKLENFDRSPSSVIWNGLRLYIEVAIEEARRHGRDYKYLKPHLTAISTTRNLFVEAIQQRLMSDLLDFFISRIALALHDHFFQGIDVRSELNGIWHECLGLHMWSGCEAAARAVAQVDPAAAADKFSELTRYQRQREDVENSIRKQTASLLYGLSRQGILYDLLDNSRPLSLAKEWLLHRETMRHQSDWERWRRDGNVRIVAAGGPARSLSTKFLLHINAALSRIAQRRKVNPDGYGGPGGT